MRAIRRWQPIFLILVVTLNLAVGELAARLAGIRPANLSLEAIPATKAHPKLGWVNRPGIQISWDAGNAPMTFWPDGRRATRRTAADPHNKESVVLLGGSYTQGYGVPDNQTFGWLLDVHFPFVRVDNYGTGGYGTYQSLLLLEELFRKDSFIPKIVVYGFASFHGERNVGAFRHVLALRTQVGERFAPPHMVVQHGQMVARSPTYIREWPLEKVSGLVSLIRLAHLNWALRDRNLQMEPVTRHLLLRMDQLVRDNGSHLLVAILDDGSPPETYEEFIRDHDISLVNCTHPGYLDNPQLRVGKIGHPNHVLHAEWANCISPSLSVILPGEAA